MHRSITNFIRDVEPLKMDDRDRRRRMALNELHCSCPHHRTDLERDNCAGYLLSRHGVTGEAPNVAGWAATLIAAGHSVEVNAFWAHVDSCSPIYREHLQRVVATFGVNFFTKADGKDVAFSGFRPARS